ncbi:hypothetical protein ACFVZH_39340 [Streptomyces sp. NPDC059534]|uniref:hypothetical protein n=1 Tax=Streptomyces sp. NPDC059534 TaxID=3346859 RepID=UPI0036864093
MPLLTQSWPTPTDRLVALRQRVRAPFVLPRKGESLAAASLVATAHGVAYADPAQDAAHRDIDGVLWAVCTGSATGGTDYASELHPERQRIAMERLLCAGCKKPAARDERGMAWGLPLLDDAADTVWDRVQTAIPPMCEVCAVLTPQVCPQLREGHVELRVREAELVGVRGTLYPRSSQGGTVDPDALLLYDDPDLPFVIARQSVRELRRITVVARGVACS